MKLAGIRILAAMFALFAPFSAWSVSFTTATTSGIAPYAPASVILADFNRDGNQDMALVLANGTSHYLRIMLGDGLGGFSGPTDLALPGDPGAATASGPAIASDFNGDGIIDLAVANTGAGNISIFLGNGTGSFTKVTPDATVGPAPTAIAIGDFRGDGITDDIGVVNSGDNSITILLNDGTGRMTPQGTSLSAAPPDSISAIAVGDFNGDDMDDIAITRNSANKVTLFRGIGVGTFAAGVDIMVGAGPKALVAADFNNDGMQDLAVLNGTDATISVINGTRVGASSVNATVDIASPTDNTANPVAIIASDLNRDGILDLAVANNAKNSIAVLTGKGDATFTPAIAAEIFSTGAAPTTLASGDLNGNGNDLLTVSSTNAGYSILLNSSPEAAGIKVTPTSYDFGKFPVNSQVMFLSTHFTISNPGSTPLTVNAMDMGGGVNSPFQVAPQYGTCGTANPVIAAGSSCTVQARFINQISEGIRSDTLTITTANAANNATLSVPLSGTIVPDGTLHSVGLSFLGRGSGTVTFSTGDASCTADCSRTPPAADLITLTATADAGSYFYGWTGCDWYFNGTCNIKFAKYADPDHNLTVNFGLVPRRVLVASTPLPVYATTVALAYSQAGNDDTIKIPSGTMGEDLVLDKDIIITLLGGFDSGFTSQGAPTVLRSLSIAKGAATLDNIVLQ